MKHAGNLSHQVEAYHAWKKELIKQISRYRNWLQDNDLFSDDVHQRIRRGIELLLEDELTIAFVGEYSRGKTELINALFFSGFGQRMLPSQAGRTTMCPTELFFDRAEGRDYLLLLPIESRRESIPLQQWRKHPQQWQRFELDTGSPEIMREVLAEVARTKSVPVAEARALGFEEAMLDHDRENRDQVMIPAWRHALISLRHPLLERGLRILDTPGLNALGSEPELTISMLPNAHAVIFLLSADTGVTASDMAMWKDYITTEDADHRAGRFAVLNKIDVLWDDLQGDNYTQASIDKVLHYTADHLGIPAEDVIPISAKQGLLGKVRGDKALRQRSGLPNLEKLIIDRILVQKEQLITRNLINDMLGMLQNSHAAMQARLAALNEEMAICADQHIDRDALRRLADRTQGDYDFYYKKLITLRSSRRLMQSQGRILSELVNRERFDDHVAKTRQLLKESWTSLGMSRAMNHFFSLIEDDFTNLLAEGKLAEKMVSSMYKRYNEEAGAQHLEPIPLRAGRHVIAIRELRKKADRFRHDPRNLLTEQTLLIKRFFNTLVSEARRLYEKAQEDVERWPEEALLPIIQFSMEQKQLLEQQIKRLHGMVQSDKSVREQRENLENAIADLRRQMELADNIQRQIRRPAPTLVQQKVVSLSGIA
ncbi:dynamin family protein [Mangrovitalea sediminis]|uniref:dynamin family protein n=1 Tax=Mangrovitalea sediminis TaxID=1982043 RepID=UPI000BE5ABEB|nr:dynamin family protein [Mangrovitalea sediminis]